MTEASARRLHPFLIAGLAALPSVVLLAMNSIEWRTRDFETIVLAYRVAIYAGLLVAAIAIFLAIRQFRRGGSHKALVISIAIALAFIVWVGPDAYLDVAEVVSSAFGAG
jgi:drug/metabolite transporter (DMT)-like permease